STPIFFEWIKDDHRKLSASEYKIDNHDTTSSLAFKSLNPNDTGSYTCNAKNVYGSDSITTKLIILESPVLVKLYSQNEQTKGSALVLTCNIAKGSKPFRFQWFKNGVELSGGSRSMIETKDIFSLYTLRNIDFNDMGNYSCVVTNEFGFDKLSIQLTVTGLKIFTMFLFNVFWAKMWR
ncbi:Immunoglobulin domain containing protein, partial [Euroglyphus maynei]